MIEISTEILKQCPLCSSSTLKTILQGYDFESKTGQYAIVHCHQCGIHFTNPRPVEQDLHKLYEMRITSDFPETPRWVEKLRKYKVSKEIKSLFKEIKSLFKGNTKSSELSILDFGCGDGFFAMTILEEVRCKEIIAVDFHHTPPRYLKDSLDAKLSYQNIELFKESQHCYDIIFCRHVLEHVSHPLEFLQQLRERMTLDGYLFIEVPHFNSIWRHLLGKYFFGLYLPRHLYHFDFITLQNLLKNASFEVISIKPTHSPLLATSLGYLLGIHLRNLGLLGMVLFPIQCLVDFLFHSSTCIAITAKVQN